MIRPPEKICFKPLMQGFRIAAPLPFEHPNSQIPNPKSDHPAAEAAAPLLRQEGNLVRDSPPCLRRGGRGFARPGWSLLIWDCGFRFRCFLNIRILKSEILNRAEALRGQGGS